MISRRTLLLSGASTLAIAMAGPAIAQARTDFKVAWSIYVGWMPWGYAADAGIVKKWADKYGLTIEVTQFNDYVESINQYTAGAYDAVTVTNMDALSIPSAGGVDTTAVIVGDFSAGNDAVFLKGAGTLADLAGRKVNLVEFSVSHYLLARALDSVGLSEMDVSVVNTADPDMVGAFQTSDVSAMVTWNPMVAEINGLPDATKVFDSSQIPGEIIDLMVASTASLAENPDFGRALAGIWYETAALMVSDTPEGAEARAAMGAASGTDQAGFEAQMAATKLFDQAAAAVAFTTSPDLSATMNLVRAFLFDKGLLGVGAPSADVIGIELPDGTVLGDAANVKLRFTADYMQMAADGAL
ncbi:MAG: putative urea ABC transporter substrate-binding protein [Pseudotabrizicola sp.]|uniref:putative urea ABC transporter substrate-binding protein n=1 Tax=Pseudotabrizicola sp. TaxID=2939647 RepID=UPI002716C372|nr:putative urea ABC transporter substrate-binding protein [Pseudotabrizicola sp.]MDO8884205.1 putative urea ABC transporter substrate-binding protein [Pseudotabrizicola sp.]MDP2081144.1 putative urea ABC transporter substrate-binding protein [Pseudotabrizicola sp.]MDZ7574562.1 putative urea ABC transporter substrate-binding protein [Pseudotabrizicola sp.]